MLSCSEDRLFVISNFVICDEKWISVFLFVSVLVIDNCRPAMCVCARRVVVDVLIVVSSLVMTFDHQFLHSTPLQHFRLLLDWHSWLKLVNYAIFFVVFDRRLSNGNLVVLLSYKLHFHFQVQVFLANLTTFGLFGGFDKSSKQLVSCAVIRNCDTCRKFVRCISKIYGVCYVWCQNSG